MKTQTGWLVLVVVLILLLGVVGRMDYEDALLQEKHACEMVKAGAWPKSFCPK